MLRTVGPLLVELRVAKYQQVFEIVKMILKYFLSSLDTLEPFLILFFTHLCNIDTKISVSNFKEKSSFF